GVTAAWASNTITINGTPNASGTFNYSIPLTGGCGSVNATGTITVSENIAGTASNTPTICVNTILTDITHSTTGATGIGTPTGLPTGVTAAWASNTITINGTPNASGTFNYSMPLTGGCGSVNATGTITVACIPTVTTTAISSITTTGASSGGNITDEGGLSVTVRGVVYSTSSNPTISNSTTSNGTGTGSFTSTLASLTGATTYYVRAYATNSVGTAYGNELTFTTSAPIPTSALICSTAPGGTITFMKHNLGADQTADPLTPSWRLNGDYYQWGRPTKAANGPSNGTGDGDAVNGVWNTTPASSTSWGPIKTSNDPCPSGFRVPTKIEWQCVISQNTLFNVGWSGAWSSSKINYSTGIFIGTGSSRIFLPTPGRRVLPDGTHVFRGAAGYYWSSTSTTGVKADTYYLQIGADATASPNSWLELTEGLSVRCVAE
ncbi:MAG: FISUMP domain-containing protein, partial [Bacteroidota bacterium]